MLYLIYVYVVYRYILFFLPFTVNEVYHTVVDTVVLSSGPCVWAEFENTNVVGGIPQRAQTIAQCRTACINTIYCVGVDIDPNPLSSFCWLTVLPDAGRAMQPFSGVTHHVLTRNAGCPHEGKSHPVPVLSSRKVLVLLNDQFTSP